LKKKKYQEAIDLFNSISQNPTKNVKVFFYRGTCYLMLHKPNIALVDFNLYLSMETEIPEAYLHRGLAHQSLKNYTFAHEDFLIYKKIKTQNTEVIKYLVYLMEEMQELDLGLHIVRN
jgi:tetratricopeptide (TPR) repeat protein